jgi:hypothetical protein
MTESGRTGEQNLTGIWNGLYTYPDGRSVAFVATLIESGGSLSGTTHERGLFGNTAYATLAGSRQDSAVSFIKKYGKHRFLYKNSVAYEGTLSSDGTEIEGRWAIGKILSGKFLMIRSPSQTAKAENKLVEPVR